MNGAEAGIEKTRRIGMLNYTPPRRPAGQSSRAASSGSAGNLRSAVVNCVLGGFDGIGRADMHPHAVEPQAEQPSRLGGAIEQRRHRERAVRRAGEEGAA